MINVVFTIDNNYVLPNIITLHSILQNNISNSKYHFFIIENDITPKNKKMLSDFVKSKNQILDFINVSTDRIDSGKILYKNHNCTHVSRIGTARILLPELMPENMNKVLYLDSDILVRSDLKELYDTDLTGYFAGMIFDHWIYTYNLEDERYFNSGVILIDLKAWRENDIMNKLINNIEQNSLIYPDQDAINNVLGKKIKLLDKTWNNQMVYDEPIDSNINHGIIHYISKKKPWLYMPFHNKYKDLYLRYWANTPIGLYRFKFIPKAITAYYQLFCFYDWRKLINNETQEEA